MWQTLPYPEILACLIEICRKKLIWTPYNCQKMTYYLVRHMGGAASELGFMHSGAGEVFARIIACVVLSSEYVLKVPNKRG